MLLFSIILILKEVVNLHGIDYMDYDFDPMNVIFNNDVPRFIRNRIEGRKSKGSQPVEFDKLDTSFSGRYHIKVFTDLLSLIYSVNRKRLLLNPSRQHAPAPRPC